MNPSLSTSSRTSKEFDKCVERRRDVNNVKDFIFIDKNLLSSKCLHFHRSLVIEFRISSPHVGLHSHLFKLSISTLRLHHNFWKNDTSHWQHAFAINFHLATLLHLAMLLLSCATNFGLTSSLLSFNTFFNMVCFLKKNTDNYTETLQRI